MTMLKEIEENVFLSKKDNYDFLFISESFSKCFELKVMYKNRFILIGFTISIEAIMPQFEILDNVLLLGINNHFIMINLDQKKYEYYEIFPVFYQFIVKQNIIIVIGELSILLLVDFKLKWEKTFNEIIDFYSLDDHILTLRDYDGNLLKIDISSIE